MKDTTCHGLPHIVKSYNNNSYTRVVLWTIFTLLGFASMIALTYNNIELFMGRTQFTQLDISEKKKLEFPTITVCPSTQFSNLHTPDEKQYIKRVLNFRNWIASWNRLYASINYHILENGYLNELYIPLMNMTSYSHIDNSCANENIEHNIWRETMNHLIKNKSCIDCHTYFSYYLLTRTFILTNKFSGIFDTLLYYYENVIKHYKCEILKDETSKICRNRNHLNFSEISKLIGLDSFGLKSSYASNLLKMKCPKNSMSELIFHNFNNRESEIKKLAVTYLAIHKALLLLSTFYRFFQKSKLQNSNVVNYAQVIKEIQKFHSKRLLEKSNPIMTSYQFYKSRINYFEVQEDSASFSNTILYGYIKYFLTDRMWEKTVNKCKNKKKYQHFRKLIMQSANKKTFVTLCEFGNICCQQERTIKKIVTEKGVCYQFNVDQDNMQYQRIPGVHHGLQLFFNLERYQSDTLLNYRFYDNIGVHVYVHAINEVIDDNTTPIFIQPGVSAAIEIEKIIRDNSKVVNDPNAVNYSKKTCHSLHRFKEIKKHLKCASLNDKDIDKTMDDCTDDDKNYKKMLLFRDKFSCNKCHNVRQETVYSTKISYSNLNPKIFYSSLALKKEQRLLIVPLNVFISNVGGAMGIALGMSLLTLIEFIEYIIQRLIIFIKKKRNVIEQEKMNEKKLKLKELEEDK
ncbi:hypothetical protein SNEBB_007061 [Seison nebaliae]|nr:hypothetical protein SNEBB_007061 [Seison nebaliae]